MEPEETGSAGSWGLWVALLGAVFALAPATYPGYWQSLDGFAPLFNARYLSPIADIATTPDLWRGAGSATFLFPHALILLGVGADLAVRLLFVVAVVAAGVGIYAWLRPLYGDRGAGLAALLYVLAPPILATVYVRGSASDAVVVGLLPLALAGVRSYRFNRSSGGIGVAVIAVLWMWRTQAGLALLASLLLIAYTLLVERDRLGVLAVTVTASAGFLSLAPVWNVRSPAPVLFQEHFLFLHQLFASDWNTAPSTPDWQDQYPFQLGYAAMAFSVVAVWLWWRRRAAETGVAPSHGVELAAVADPGLTDRLLAFSIVSVLAATILSLAIGAPVWRLTGAGRLLTYPWQVLLPVLPFLAALAGSLPALHARLACRGYWAALTALALMSSYPYLTAQYTSYTPPNLPAAVFGEHTDLVLLEAHVRENAQEAVLEAVWQPLRPLPFDYNIFFQALQNAGDDRFQVVAQLDQQPLPDKPATTWRPGEIFTNTYRLELPVDPAQRNLRYYFGYYDWRDGSRLPLSRGLDDKVVLYGE